MLCRGVVHEPSGKKSCWLPADHFEPHGLCRRCLFYAYTEWLDGLRGPRARFDVIEDRSFLEACLHPGRQQSLLSVLVYLLEQKHPLFYTFLDRLKRVAEFQIMIPKRFESHSTGPRCRLYQKLLQKSYFTPSRLCESCWSCLAWCIANERCQATLALQFSSCLRKLTREVYLRDGTLSFSLCLDALHRQGKDHYVRLFLDHLRLILTEEEKLEFVMQLFRFPFFLQTFFLGNLDRVVPLSLLQENFQQTVKKRIFLFLKQHQSLFKEELMAATWHPSRFFTWCLDLDDLMDFEYP